MAGSEQHNASKRGYPRRVADNGKGNISVEVKADNWGQDNDRDCSLEKFQSRNGSDEFDVRQAVDQSVFLFGQIWISGEGFCSRQSASMGAVQDRRLTSWKGPSPERYLSSN